MKSRPVLALTHDHHAELRQYFEEMIPSLSRYFELRDATAGADLTAAEGVAAMLADVVHSSDVDASYYPCVLLADDPASDAFFAAMGIDRDARADVSGYDNPKLEVVRAGEGEDRRSTLALLTRFGDYEMSHLDEYIEEPDLGALQGAGAALTAIGPVVGIQLCTDEGVGKLVLVVAERSPGVHVGVATVRIET